MLFGMRARFGEGKKKTIGMSKLLGGEIIKKNA